MLKILPRKLGRDTAGRARQLPRAQVEGPVKGGLAVMPDTSLLATKTAVTFPEAKAVS
jgi:hypothetical protein